MTTLDRILASTLFALCVTALFVVATLEPLTRAPGDHGAALALTIIILCSALMPWALWRAIK